MYDLNTKNIIVYFYNNSHNSSLFKNITFRHMEQLFGISKSTIYRWIKNESNKILFNEKKQINKLDYDTFYIISCIQYFLDEFPTSRYIDIQLIILKELNIYLSLYKIKKYIKLINYTRKKVSINNYRGSLFEKNNKIQNFIQIVKNINNNNIICIDETYVKNEICNMYGYSKRGEKIIINKKITNKLKYKYSIIMAVNNKKILYYEIHEKSGINSSIFNIFMKKLIEKYKLNKNYFLMDNVSFHKSKIINEYIKSTTNKLLFIPPYSPECNPIENVFSDLKKYIKNNNYIINNKENLNDAINDYNL